MNAAELAKALEKIIDKIGNIDSTNLSSEDQLALFSGVADLNDLWQVVSKEA